MSMWNLSCWRMWTSVNLISEKRPKTVLTSTLDFSIWSTGVTQINNVPSNHTTKHYLSGRIRHDLADRLVVLKPFFELLIEVDLKPLKPLLFQDSPLDFVLEALLVLLKLLIKLHLAQIPEICRALTTDLTVGSIKFQFVSDFTLLS